MPSVSAQPHAVHNYLFTSHLHCKRILFLLYNYVYACVLECEIAHTSAVLRGQKVASDPLELQSQVVVKSPV